MDAFVRCVCEETVGNSDEPILDVADKGRAFLLNRRGHLWRADGRLLHLEKSAYYDAHRYELKFRLDRSWASLTCESLHAHADGAFVLIHATQECGYRREHVVFLVDTNAAVPKDLPKPKRVRTGKDQREYVFITHKTSCLAQEVDEARIAANRLEVLQVSWHAHSLSHFAVLTSDNAFSIFSLHQPSTPEQLFKINPMGSMRAQFSILSLEAASSDPLAFVSFAFGSVHAWDPLLVYLMARSGAVYTLGPVAPFGMQLSAAAVLALKDACQDDPAVLTWLQAATESAEVAAPRQALLQKDFWRVASSQLRIAPHHTPGRVAALQGPLIGAADRGDVYSHLLLLADSGPRRGHGPGGGGGGGAPAVSAFVSIGVPGKVHAYVAVGVLPALPLPDWSAGEPVADTDSRGMLTHVCQTISHVQSADEDVEPPPPLDDLQLQLPASRGSGAAAATAANGAGVRQQERVWARAPRMDAASACSGTAAPLAALQLAGSLWKVEITAVAVLSGRAPLPGAAASDSAGAASSGPIGNGAGSSTPSASPRSARLASVLPRSRVECVHIPAVEARGLRCVRMFWNVLVGDVVLGLLGDGAGFSSDGGAIAAAGPPLPQSAGDSSRQDGSDFEDVGDALLGEERDVGRAAAGAAGVRRERSPPAGEDVDDSVLQAERSMRLAYQLERPEIPRVADKVPADAVGAPALKALDTGVTALIASGVAHCEHMHVRLMERFRVVAAGEDAAASDADVRDVHATIEGIVDRNKELHERVLAAVKEHADVSDRTNALCNATLLNAAWRHCALNAAEERASTDITHAEEQLASTQRSAQRIAERVRSLSAPPEPSAAAGGAAAGLGDARHGGGAVAWGAGRGGALRFGRNGKTFAEPGTGHTRWGGAATGAERHGLWGGAAAGSTRQSPAGAVVKAAVAGAAQHAGQAGRGRGGRSMDGCGRAGREAQRWKSLSQQVEVVRGRLHELQALQREVGQLFEEAARQFR
eukprot:jgi/Ulvmu1/5734/UM245_0002.1